MIFTQVSAFEAAEAEAKVKLSRSSALCSGGALQHTKAASQCRRVTHGSSEHLCTTPLWPTVSVFKNYMGEDNSKAGFL